MKILADTNIFIDYWKNPKEEEREIFQQNEIAICGVIETELLRGSNSDSQFNQIKDALNCFEYLIFEEDDWYELAKLFIKLRKEGLSVPFQDGIIAYLAKKYNYKIWSNDKHFKLIQTVIPELSIY